MSASAADWVAVAEVADDAFPGKALPLDCLLYFYFWASFNNKKLKVDQVDSKMCAHFSHFWVALFMGAFAAATAS